MPFPPMTDEIRENLARIQDVPTDLLPQDSIARSALRVLASAGYDCYAYQSGGPIGLWCIWLGELAQARADRNGRVPVSEWIASWIDLLTVAVNAHNNTVEAAQ